ncbi:hypothetical protein GJ654_18555 [Rhodoblastus acidophilus]|uniref:Uncharacterized protein n=1 Tax=Rhodoblastus acidophilus TaxID=1074 RepID=A0A6N8DT36_RHOAC|nr:hypothetical protein [Rhodoblastus acidophilus]MCW2276324.1 hypothetical protein [Rhodoblastus acidophilus]MTV32986.1 hypothetical protein [Rhodoblastus acidophilus]
MRGVVDLRRRLGDPVHRMGDRLDAAGRDLHVLRNVGGEDRARPVERDHRLRAIKRGESGNSFGGLGFQVEKHGVPTYTARDATLRCIAERIVNRQF